MKILLTGATGYIGKRLLPVLIDAGYHVVCAVRDPKRFNPAACLLPNISIVKADLLNSESLEAIPKDISGAYYLVHSMSNNTNYEELERRSAINFRNYLNSTKVEHVLYLGGIINETALSKHLSSRKNVEIELAKGDYAFTALRAGIIIGSGSASFEIIRDLVEKLPVMVAPKWLHTKCQPIGVQNVISYLHKSLFNKHTYNQNFDIGGPDILSYKEMLLQFAHTRTLMRYILIVPVMTPRLSSYWLYFVTSTSYKLAVSLVNSMKIEVLCRETELNKLLNIRLTSYVDSLKGAFRMIENNDIISSWKDAHSSGRINIRISDFIQVPHFGCFEDKRRLRVSDKKSSIERIWQIGGNRGWYYGTWLWRLRGFLDKLVGGVGLRRGRTNPVELNVGDALDFWRVLYADKSEGRLLLFAEMKLPGEAWLEFKISNEELHQTATFRPLGILGRLYWFAVMPFHTLIFRGMLKRLAR